MRGFPEGFDCGRLVSRPLDAAKPAPFERVIRLGLESICQRDEQANRYKARRDPPAVRKELPVALPWITEISRATNLRLRQGIFRVRKHLPPADA